MDYKKVKADVKNEKFFFVSEGYFIFITPDGEQNKLCIFDEIITDLAIDFADKHTPKIKTNKEKRDYITKAGIAYWSELWNIFVWEYLEKNNTITYMKKTK